MNGKKNALKYFKMTLQYANKKIWYLIFLAALPSVLTAFVFTPYATFDFFAGYRQLYYARFSDMYLIISGFNTNIYYLGIIGIIAIPFFYSIMFGAVERHMRVGEFNLGFDRIRSRLNFNFITAFKFALTLFAVYEIFKFFETVVFYLLARLFDVAWAFSLSIIWYIILYAAQLFLLSITVLWVPTMLQTGLSGAKSLGLAVKQGSKYTFGTMISIMIPTVPMLVLMLVNSILGLNVGVVLSAILLTITEVFYTVYMYSMFFDINGIEREDLKKVDIWKQGKKRFKEGKDGSKKRD